MLGGEYTWKETAAAVHVRVQLKGCSAKAVDVFAADVYCKISYPPRLIELDLLHPVDEDAAQAKIKDGVLTLTLPKKQPETWGALVCGKGTLTKVRDPTPSPQQHCRAACDPLLPWYPLLSWHVVPI
jgi:hypothetical protein